MNTKDASYLTSRNCHCGMPALAACMGTGANELRRKFNPAQYTASTRMVRHPVKNRGSSWPISVRGNSNPACALVTRFH